MKNLAVILSGALFFAAPLSATNYRLGFTPEDHQARRMVDGVAAIESAATGSKIRLVASENPVGKRGTVQLMVFNGSTKPFDVGSESVTAALMDGTAVQIITGDQLAHEEKKRATWRGIGAALFSPGVPADAGWSNSTINYNETTSGKYGSYYTGGAAQISTYSAADAQRAQALTALENQETFDRVRLANQVGRMALKANLKTTTVDPGSAAGGLITFELPAAARNSKSPVQLRFVVTTGSEHHTIVASLQPL